MVLSRYSSGFSDRLNGSCGLKLNKILMMSVYSSFNKDRVDALFLLKRDADDGISLYSSVYVI